MRRTVWVSYYEISAGARSLKEVRFCESLDLPPYKVGKMRHLRRGCGVYILHVCAYNMSSSHCLHDLKALTGAECVLPLSIETLECLLGFPKKHTAYLPCPTKRIFEKMPPIWIMFPFWLRGFLLQAHGISLGPPTNNHWIIFGLYIRFVYTRQTLFNWPRVPTIAELEAHFVDLNRLMATTSFIGCKSKLQICLQLEVVI